jgi:hypothetical protein
MKKLSLLAEMFLMLAVALFLLALTAPLSPWW